MTHVQIFLNEDNEDEPYMIFHVADAPAFSSKEVHVAQPRSFEDFETTLERSADGRSVINEYIMRARL